MTSLKLILIPLSVIVLIMLYLAVLSFLSRHNSVKAESERLLQPCPDKPNCVSSLATDAPHSVDPLPILDNDREGSWQRLLRAVQQSGGNIVAEDGSYCHAVYTTTLFRFKDDVEVKLQEKDIAIRSASRVGTSDLGKNRARVEQIKAIYISK